MLAKSPPCIQNEVFQNALLRAVTEGQAPSRTTGLGRETRSIIEAIAERHPEANPDLLYWLRKAAASSAADWRFDATRSANTTESRLTPP